MKFAVAAEHGGFTLLQPVIDALMALGHEPILVGPATYVPHDDYPDIAEAVGRAIQSGTAERGVLICGSGVGVTIAANKMVGVRACVCHDLYSAAQGVEHDDMNVLCLGGRVISPELAAELVRAFAGAQFNAAERFVRRLSKVAALEHR